MPSDKKQAQKLGPISGVQKAPQKKMPRARPASGFAGFAALRIVDVLRKHAGRDVDWEVFSEVCAVWVSRPLPRAAAFEIVRAIAREKGGALFWRCDRDLDDEKSIVSQWASYNVSGNSTSRVGKKKPSNILPVAPKFLTWQGKPITCLVIGPIDHHLKLLNTVKSGEGNWKKSDYADLDKLPLVGVLDINNGESAQSISDYFDVTIPASEGLIKSGEETTNPGDAESSEMALPTVPPRLWPARSRGRPPSTPEDPLIAFLDAVYGPYMTAHRDVLRSYIHQKDIPLYRAIQDYERRKELPPRLAMPTREEVVVSRLQRAAADGFVGMTRRERRSVTGKLWRSSKPKP